MSEQAGPTPDPAETSRRIAELMERSRRAVDAFLARQAQGDMFQIPDPRVVTEAFARFGQALMRDPQRYVDAQLRYWQQMGELWQRQLRRLAGEKVPPLVEPDRSDRRFKDEAWSEDLVFDFLKQSYLLTARWMQELVGQAEGLDPKTREKIAFYTRQLVDAMAPSNFPVTNPQVLRHAIETNGESLVKGLERLLADLERGRGQLRISMTREDAFEVGRNLAVTPGQVIHENELMQLIQYAPSTEEVYRRPLVIVPPWINKYYILDLTPRNSFIKYCVDQGFTVFVLSWVNPDERLAHKTFDDYMVEGPLAAFDAVQRQTGEDELNVIGYCIGGTLTACTLAYMAAKGDARIKAATFFTTMLDFSEPGELGVFIDEEQLRLIEEHMKEKGYLEARHMQQVFNLLRANDLIWNFVVNNYLLGREPMVFDILYWNADSTRMPFMMHQYYLRNMYQENRLTMRGGISLKGVPIDLGKVTQPAYFLSTREDHIAPWKATYRGARLLGGPVRFVLGGSGHIAGVVNPASSTKYGYWTNSRLPADPEAWLASASFHEGSWWPDWASWNARRSGKKVPARDPASGPLRPIEPVPGRYVRVRTAE